MQKRLFHFSYSLQQTRSELLLHALRDGDAFAEIEAVLMEGYDYHSRSLVKLSSEMAAKLKKPDRGEIELSQHHGARYLRHRTPISKSGTVEVARTDRKRPIGTVHTPRVRCIGKIPSERMHRPACCGLDVM